LQSLLMDKHFWLRERPFELVRLFHNYVSVAPVAPNALEEEFYVGLILSVDLLAILEVNLAELKKIISLL
jgi:hypothetical protein